LVEAHFAQRHYGVVTTLMREIAAAPAAVALLRGIVEFWQ